MESVNSESSAIKRAMTATCSSSTAPCLTGLPHEILVRIVLLLPPGSRGLAALACSSLRAATISSLSSLSHLDLKLVSPGMDDASFLFLCRHLSNTTFRHLELDCWHLSSSALRLLPEGIESLALCGCDNHSDDLVQTLATRVGPNLRRFAFSGFSLGISEAPFLALASRCRSLAALAIDCGEIIDVNRIVKHVASCCPLLSELSAFDLTQATLSDLIRSGCRLRKLLLKRRHVDGLPVTDVSLLLVLGLCPQLEELLLVDKTEDDTAGEISDAGLLLLASCHLSLRVLKLKLPSLAAASNCSEVAVMQLASACTRLTSLELSNFRLLTDPPVYEIVHRCPLLSELQIDSALISDASLEFIAMQLPALKSLSLRGSRKVTDCGMRAVGRLKSLESLNAALAGGVTDASVAEICRGATGLKSLVFNYGLLSDSAMRSIASLSKLEELALHGCSKITNAGVGLVAVGCPLLRFLSVSFCDQISDKAVVAVANHCPRLLKIRLDGCRQLSDPCVRALCRPKQFATAVPRDVHRAPFDVMGSKSWIVEGCGREALWEHSSMGVCEGALMPSRLRYLSMQNCPKLSDGVFVHLLQAPALRFVDLSRAKLTTHAITSYHEQRPLVDFCIDGIPFSSTSP